MPPKTSKATQPLPAPYANHHEQSLRPSQVIHAPGKSYRTPSRKWQGIASLERTTDGTLYATWYSGGTCEGVGNYLILQSSKNNGRKWSTPILAVTPNEGCRCFDPLPWQDPQGRLWFFWGQTFSGHNGRDGVWFIRCDKPQTKTMKWTKPERLCDGVMMNKPTVLMSGEWLFPVTLWGAHLMGGMIPELRDWYYPHVIASADKGASWEFRGKAQLPERVRSCDEHMIVEHLDGTLSMFIRTKWGIGKSLSSDGGRNWSYCNHSGLPGVESRFFIRRCASGRLLLVTHNDGQMRRTNLTAYLSEDDGKTWGGGLLLDDRMAVSYPDGAEDGNGRWFIIYDRERNDSHWHDTGAGEILLADFTEEDVIAGTIKAKTSCLQIIIDRLSKKK